MRTRYTWFAGLMLVAAPVCAQIVGCGQDASPAGQAGSVGVGSTSAGSGGTSTGSGGADTGGSSASVGSGGASTGSGATDAGTPLCQSVTSIDLLLVIDNSRSMGITQAELAGAIPELLRSLTNPPCVDPTSVQPPIQPATPTDACPAGMDRAFLPQTDIHIGVISSSIGGHGADACPDSDPSSSECSGMINTTANDKGHLLSRTAPCGSGTAVPTYLSQGFLAWDPTQMLNPAGEADLEQGLLPNLASILGGVGDIGCGFESQLESSYRFLIDPEPYLSISLVNGYATPMGTDATLLAQRAAFLRPDSLLAVILLTDENDCSIKEYGQYFYAAQLRVGNMAFHLPRARQECATTPNDPCCLSCGQTNLPPSCAPDPSCTINGGYLTDTEDPANLRCWDQKRRFGIDFLYPTGRYVQALTSPMIANSQGMLVANPIFSDLDPNDGHTNIRSGSLVLFTGITGVPWQDIARDPNDLAKGFKNAAELSAADPSLGNKNVWDVILGDPSAYIAPLDPLMVESVLPRSGTNPITGDPLVPSSMPLGNPINGHERTIPGSYDLQYACIFPLATARDCSQFQPNLPLCVCNDPTNDDPLCAPNPADNNAPTLQVRGKAYPGTRLLSVLKGIGPQGVVTSACPRTPYDPTTADSGYRPAIRAILDWLTVTGC